MSAKPSHIIARVWRGSGDGGGLREYEVPALESQTVLDVVTWIQRHIDASLSYRFACRVGMCGTCAMMVNGRPRWTCRTHVDKVLRDDAITIEPLKNLPVIKDLACDLTGFFDKWKAARGHFVPTSNRERPVEKISPDEPGRQAADAGIECINCAVCYAACDAVAGDSGYLGPAALNRAWTLYNDRRDGDRDALIRAVTGPGGCQGCHSQQGCTAHCPNELNPTRAIAGLKRAATHAYFRRKT